MKLDLENIKNKIESIDMSDLSVLLWGIILMVIPISFLYFQIKKPDEKLSVYTLQDGAFSNRKGFFYIQDQELKSSKAYTSKNFYHYADTNKEWSKAIAKVAETANTIPDQVRSLPTEIRLYYEAEQNAKLRWTNALINLQRYKEALNILQEMSYNNDESNPFLTFMISANLCTVYEKLGLEKELIKEFNKLVYLISKLPNIGFKAEVFKGLSEWLKLEEIFSKLKNDPQITQTIKNILSNRGIQNTIILPKVITEQIQSPEKFFFNKVEQNR